MCVPISPAFVGVIIYSPNMVASPSRRFRQYVSCHTGKIEIAEVNSSEESALLASAVDAFFACGSASTKEQAWAIRDEVAEVCDYPVYSFRLLNDKARECRYGEPCGEVVPLRIILPSSCKLTQSKQADLLGMPQVAMQGAILGFLRRNGIGCIRASQGLYLRD
jgi:hypothetical protein